MTNIAARSSGGWVAISLIAKTGKLTMSIE
jgi:hypothetical protein